jgi:hypothetical protein
MKLSMEMEEANDKLVRKLYTDWAFRLNEIPSGSRNLNFLLHLTDF